MALTECVKGVPLTSETNKLESQTRAPIANDFIVPPQRDRLRIVHLETLTRAHDNLRETVDVVVNRRSAACDCGTSIAETFKKTILSFDQ